jgi:competence protein ComEA
VRGVGTPGRGERGRVAQRVRAILAEVPRPGAEVSPAERLDPLPWLPDDDFTVALPSAPAVLAAPSPTRSSPPAPSAADTAALHAGPLEWLATRLSVRVDPGRRGAVAVGVAVLVAAVVTGVWVFSSRPHAVAVDSSPSRPDVVPAASPTPAAAASAALGPSPARSPSVAPTSPVVLVVDVAGKVRHPGLYQLPVGSRVDDAVHAAGGPLPGVDLTSLNLAAKITDGQQIAVGAPGAAPGGGPSGGGGATGSVTPSPVDLNSATLEQLEALPGVGPVLGQHILDWRDAHGSFATVDQLRDVSGIGDVKFAALRSRVTV